LFALTWPPSRSVSFALTLSPSLSLSCPLTLTLAVTLSFPLTLSHSLGLEQALVDERNLGEGEVRVVVVGDHERVRHDFIKVATRTLGLDARIFHITYHSLSPAAIMHFDRDPINNIDPQLAATGAKWAILELLMLAACDGLVVSSGYGLTAADVGGLSPQRTLRVKRGGGGGGGGGGDRKRQRRCLPSDAAPWMEFL